MARIICDLLCINADVPWHIRHPRRVGVIQRPLMTSCRAIARNLPILNFALFETDMGWYRQRGIVDKHHIQFTLVPNSADSFYGNQRAFKHCFDINWWCLDVFKHLFENHVLSLTLFPRGAGAGAARAAGAAAGPVSHAAAARARLRGLQCGAAAWLGVWIPTLIVQRHDMLAHQEMWMHTIVFII